MISIDIGPGRFNFRAAGVCIDQGFVLLQQFAGATSWCLPGGRVEISEPTMTTMQREWQEELHEAVQIERLLWVAENFFATERGAFHEIGFYYLVTPPAESAYADKARTYAGADGDVAFTLRWFALDTLADVVLFPLFLRQGLRALPPTLAHVVERE